MPGQSRRPPAAWPPASSPPAGRQTAQERARAIQGRTSRDARRRPPPAWVHPLPGARLTSCYGVRAGLLHAGVDLAAPAGTPVRAAGAGRVVSAGWTYPGYGVSVLIDHGGGTRTHYAHLAATAVRPGDRVTAGQIVGREGSTGDSTGPHLHFEVHRGRWRQVDPVGWLAARGVRLNAC